MGKQVLAQRWPWLIAAGLALLAFLSSFVQIRRPGEWDTRPRGSVEDIARLAEREDVNVLFLLIDTLRAERLGSYGYERDTSPVFDQLARSGVRFDRHLAQSSWTKSSMASLWTGLYPQHTGVTRYNHVIPPAAQMAAELLREGGFQTVGLWRNGWVSSTFGFEQGFDVYQRPLPKPMPAHVRRENPTLSERSTDEALIGVAAEFLRVSGQQRWFLYMHMMDLHEYMYDAESALFGTTHADLYDNSIRWTDGTLARLLQALSGQGLLEKTLIVIASDHGEAFLERGAEGHARDVYREATEVPLLIAFPFRLEPGLVVEARSQNVDVLPTLLDLLGLESPEGLDGRSRLPDILASASGQVAEDDGAVAIADLDQTWGRQEADPKPTVAVVDGELRYVRVPGEGDKLTEQLFDATDDPLELRNRAGEQPETLERLRAVADGYLEQQPPWGETPTRELDELELNLLRALGYKIE